MSCTGCRRRSLRRGTAGHRAARYRGDRALAAALEGLRQPTAAAWLVNLLVRAQPEAVEELLALGQQLRAAQTDPAGPALRERRPAATKWPRMAHRPARGSWAALPDEQSGGTGSTSDNAGRAAPFSAALAVGRVRPSGPHPEQRCVQHRPAPWTRTAVRLPVILGRWPAG